MVIKLKRQLVSWRVIYIIKPLLVKKSVSFCEVGFEAVKWALDSSKLLLKAVESGVKSVQRLQ